MSKDNLRKWAKEERKKLNIEAISYELRQKLQERIEYKQAKNIMIFYPKKDEIDLLDLLDDKTKNFYLPKIEGKSLICCPFNKDMELYESCFKTKEPYSEAVNKDVLDLVIVPALAVDKNNYRLGYGGGFYDRFLQDLKCYKLTCISKEMVIESVFPSEFDIPIEIIITA